MRPIDIVRRLCPRARPEYLAAFESGDDQIRAAGITTPRRLAHFLAQALHETDGLTIAVESGNYSAERMMQVWPSRFPTIESARPYAHNAEKLFNNVYGGRMGNVEPGDGFRYRGRGVLQTTGRESYRTYGKKCGVDFEGNPDLILSAEHALKPALAEWVAGGCNGLADAGNIRAITKRINGGYIGLDSRMSWLRRVESVIGDQVVEFSTPKPKAETKPAPEPVNTVPGHPASASVAGAAAVVAAGSGYGFSWPTIAALAIGAAVVGFVVWKIVRSK